MAPPPFTTLDTVEPALIAVLPACVPPPVTAFLKKFSIPPLPPVIIPNDIAALPAAIPIATIATVEAAMAIGPALSRRPSENDLTDLTVVSIAPCKVN